MTTEISHSCSACTGEMAHFFETHDFNRLVSDEKFRYARCVQCGQISLVNVPKDLGRYYTPGYHMIPESEAAIEAGVAHDRYKIDLVRQFSTTGRLLEIGPAWGAFSLLAKRAGFSVETIEMDPACREFLKSRLGIPAIKCNDEADAVTEASAPDVVAAWHVFEHLRDPWRLLDRVAKHLAPGGIVVLALPNPGAFQFSILRRLWAHVDAPRHVHLIPPAVLRSRAKAVGLEQILCTTTDSGSLSWNRFGWQYSLPHLSRNATVKRALRLAGRVVATVLAPIENREGRGSAYTAVFRKLRRTS